MKFLQQILFAAILAVGLTLTVSAQREQEGKKEKPPKNNAEIKPEEKKPPRNNENNNRGNENRPKKPQAYFLISLNRIEITSI